MHLYASSALAITLGLGMATQATAQSAAKVSDNQVEEVVITGSLIRGTPEDAALPVDVITNEALQEQGSPSLVDLVRTIPSVSGGNIGESNRFLGGAAAGVATINLRGLGLTRTLSLMNGERLSTITAAGGQEFVNINVVPTIAIGQVEVLRDGAAATYGSDAVAGVVNFITRRDLDGFEVNGKYALIDGSDGDYETSLAWGRKLDNGNVMLAASYRHRSELIGADLPWTLPNAVFPDTLNVSGISGASSPGGYNAILGTPVIGPNGGFVQDPTRPGIPLGATLSSTFSDAGCTQLGGLSFAPNAQCFYPFTYHDNRVANEDHYQLYGEANFELNDSLKFHGEVLWSRTEVPDDRVSASQSTVQFPTPIEASGSSPGGGSSPMPAAPGAIQSRYYVPASNPGLQALFNPCPTGTQPQITAAICAAALANGVTMNQTQWRPAAMGGNPLHGFDADRQSNEITSYRVVGGLIGELANGWEWRASLNYMRAEQIATTPDRYVNRIQLALRGLGGPGCNPSTGAPGVGSCQYFNPFANSIQKSSINGANYAESTGLKAGPAVDPALWGWLQDNAVSTTTQQLATAQVQLAGDFGDLKLWSDDPISWAVGAQLRYNDRTIELSTNFDGDVTPCVDSQPYGDGLPTCAVPGGGPFTFIGSGRESEVDRQVTSFFGEMQVPVLDNVVASLAIRTERYGGNIGDTTNPRASIRWQVTPWMALRGSAGTTFRAPPVAALDPGFGFIQAQFTNPVTGAPLYRPVQTFGNPNLEPETAETYNVGFLFESGTFQGQIDFYKFAFKDEITTETAARVYGSMFPSSNPANWQCGTSALFQRFQFGTDVVNSTLYGGQAVPSCHPNNFLSVRNNVINGPDTEITGIDINGSYTWLDFFTGDLTLGGDASILTDYKRGAGILLNTNIVFDAALNRAGKSELLSAFYSYPALRGNAYANWSVGDHNLRWTTRYWAGTDDVNAVVAGNRVARDDRWVSDFTYRLTFQERWTGTLSVKNVFDDQPPFYKSQYNYDYMTQNPLGRVFEFGVQAKF
jgi:iron complex outermembrane receptor protein